MGRPGADVNKLGVDGEEDLTTPITHAIVRRDVPLVRLLVKAGVDVNQIGSDGGDLPLCEAAFDGDVRLVKILLEAGADVKKAEKTGESDGWTPLYTAVMEGTVPVWGPFP